MKKQRGITLIALIITIIVMLILVGVTINVALNGSLFETTQLAADGTKKEAEKEQLLAAILAAVGTDGEVDFAKVVLPEGFTGSDGTYTGKSGTTYTVNKETLEISVSPDLEKEKETLQEAIAAAKGENGEVDFSKVVLPTGFTKVSDGTYKGKSGTTYLVDQATGEITIKENIFGTYYVVGTDLSAVVGYTLKENGIAEMVGYFVDEENLSNISGTYTYDETAQKGTMTFQIETINSDTQEKETETEEFSFEYATIVDENNTVINSILGIFFNKDERVLFGKENYTGLIPLGNNVYENGTTTIEFGTATEDGITFGTYIFNFDGTPSYSENEGTYACYSGNLWLSNEGFATISEDYSTITLEDGTVYTLKQQ